MIAGAKHSAESSGDSVTVNPLLVFIIIFIAPYLLFILLLMLVTGRTDIELIYYSVLENGDTVFFKAWVIGTFSLALIATAFLTGRRTKTYIVEHYADSRASRLAHSGSVERSEYLPAESTSSPESLLPDKSAIKIVPDTGNDTPSDPEAETKGK